MKKITIYAIHSSKINYKEEFYKPLLLSDAAKHNLILPLTDKYKEKYAKDLVAKLTKNNSIYDKRRYTHLEKFDDNSRSDNKQLFYTIEQIEEAIRNNKDLLPTNFKEFKIIKELDESLIGGIKVIINSKVIDNSLIQKLRSTKEANKLYQNMKLKE